MKNGSVKMTSRQTIRKEWNTLLSCLRYAKRFGVYTGDPEMLQYDFVGPYIPGSRALSKEEYMKLRGSLPEHRRDYLHAYVAIGQRDSKLYVLTPSDIDAGNKMVHIRGTKTTDSDRWVPVQDDTLLMLLARAENLDPDEPLFSEWGNVRRDLADACKRAGIEKVTPNDLRRTFATWLAEAGVPELVVASLMGHTTSQMVRKVYAKIGSKAKREAIALQPSFSQVLVSDEAQPPKTSTEIEDSQSFESDTSPTVTLIVSNPGTNHGNNRLGGNEETRELPEFSGLPVPRDRIELPTRGFSVLCSTD